MKLLNSFPLTLQEVELDIEGMQSTIYYLQQQLKLAKETIANLTKSNADTTAPSAAVEDISVSKEEEVEEKPRLDEQMMLDEKQEELKQQPETDQGGSNGSTKVGMLSKRRFLEK
jgi:hypothetical protein